MLPYSRAIVPDTVWLGGRLSGWDLALQDYRSQAVFQKLLPTITIRRATGQVNRSVGSANLGCSRVLIFQGLWSPIRRYRHLTMSLIGSTMTVPILWGKRVDLRWSIFGP
jgi:hypothetical protein